MDRRLGSLDGQRVHHLDRRRIEACSDDIADRGARLICGIEGRQQDMNALRALDHSQRDLGRDAQGAFRTHEDSG